MMIGFDYLENIFTLVSISNIPEVSTPLVLLETTASSLKWALSGIISTAIIGFLSVMFYKKIKTTSSH